MCHLVETDRPHRHACASDDRSLVPKGRGRRRGGAKHHGERCLLHAEATLPGRAGARPAPTAPGERRGGAKHHGKRCLLRAEGNTAGAGGRKARRNGASGTSRRNEGARAYGDGSTIEERNSWTRTIAWERFCASFRPELFLGLKEWSPSSIQAIRIDVERL